jgi:hypothetical protein
MAFELGQTIATMLKQSGWHFLAIAVAAAFLVFVPDALLHSLGLDSFRSANRQWIGLALVISTPLALFSGVKWFVDEGNRKHRRIEEEQDRTRRDTREREERLEQLEGMLRNLGDDEWDILNEMLDNNIGAKAFGMEHSAALSLHAKGILGRPGQVVPAFSRIHYTLNPWVPELLRKKPELRRRRQPD